MRKFLAFILVLFIYSSGLTAAFAQTTAKNTKKNSAAVTAPKFGNTDGAII